MSESGVIPRHPADPGYHMKVSIAGEQVEAWIGSLVLSLTPPDAMNLASQLIYAATEIQARLARPWKQGEATMPP